MTPFGLPRAELLSHFIKSRMNSRSPTRRAFASLLTLVLFAPGCTNPAAQDAKNESGEAARDEHKDEVKLSPEAVARYGIRVAATTRQALTPTVIAPARVAFNADATAHVGVVLRGRVVELKAKKGDAIRLGDELLVVESPELGEAQSNYLQKRVALQVAKPAADLAKDAYERAKKLYDDAKGITITELQKREGDVQSADGALKSAESAVTAAANKLRLLGMEADALARLEQSGEIHPRYAITAPIDGQVTEREVTLGELVSPDKDALLVIADLKTLWVLADVPEARLAEIAVGSPAKVAVSAIGATPLEGKISLIDPALDPTTRSARVRIEVPNPSGDIRPGMFAQAEITAANPPAPVLAIPDAAVQTVEGSAAVFVPVKGEPHTFAKRPVTVGGSVGGFVSVLAGLKEGDEIVTAGSFILKADLGKSAAHED